MSALVFDHVGFSYGETEVLKDVNFSIEQGEFVAIMGPNGTGKSTSLRLINGLLSPTSGSVTVMGMNTAKHRTSEIARKVGFLFQNPDRQICCNTIAEEVEFGLKTLYGKDKEKVSSRARETMEMLHLDPAADPFGLSRGQRQAVALAGLIAVGPELLVLDEPTTGFDYAECMEMMAHIARLNEAGTTVIMVCHDMEVVLDFADRAIVLSGGSVVADGPTRSVFADEQALQAASLLPPQIYRLSSELEKKHPGLGGIFEAETMVDALASMSEGGR